jgi:hypothetical protein
VNAAGFDVEKAAHALAESGSRFCAHAADWLVHMDDPVALLLVLTKETGPALGPWATFRWCALLGLSPSVAVRGLAADVASEAPDHPLSAVDAAFAKAHVKDLYGDLTVEHVDTVVDMLARTDNDDVPVARLALANAGLAPSESSFAALIDATWSSEHAVRAAGPVLEALLLVAPVARQQELVARAVHMLAESQDESGLVVVSGRARGDRASDRSANRFVTLRALALTTRLARERR